jgi:hypothetical protein
MHMPGGAGHEELDGRYFNRAALPAGSQSAEGWRGRKFPESGVDPDSGNIS